MLDRHHADREKIKDLERQVWQKLTLYHLTSHLCYIRFSIVMQTFKILGPVFFTRSWRWEAKLFIFEEADGQSPEDAAKEKRECNKAAKGWHELCKGLD